MARRIITCTKIPERDRDTIHQLPLDSYGDIHPGPVGTQVSYGVDLDDEQFEWLLSQGPSNLIHAITVGDRGMGWTPSTIPAEYQLRDFIGDPETGIARAMEEEGETTETVEESTRTYRYWRPGPILDQGSEGACVGFSAAAFKGCDPLMSSVDDSEALRIYRRAQHLDQWPGTDYSGTSVDAGCKVLREDETIEVYAWATTKAELYYWILNKGPVMLGMDWYEGMYVTDRNGFIRPTGRRVGGHAILARGRSAWKSLRLQNSWGRDFGESGYCWLSEVDLSFLMSTRVDMATSVQVRL